MLCLLTTILGIRYCEKCWLGGCMVVILDCISEKGAQERSNLYYLICLRHLIRSRAVTNWLFFSPKRPICLHAWATYSILPSNINLKVPWVYIDLIFGTIRIELFSIIEHTNIFCFIFHSVYHKSSWFMFIFY